VRVANWTTRRFDEIAIGESASHSRTLAVGRSDKLGLR
jgi:hypothetical protein